MNIPKYIFLIILSEILILGCINKQVDFKHSSNIQSMPVVGINYYENPVEYNTVNQNHPYAQKIENISEDAIKEGIPGIIILVDTQKEGTWVSAKGKIDLKNNIPIKKNSLSRIGSITKIFTAVVIHRLIQEGYFTLDDRMSKYLDNKILKGISNADKVTIRQLLSHTSGIPNYTDYFNVSELYLKNSNSNLTSLNALKMINNLPAAFNPGSKCYYSNTNYILLGLIAETVTKKSLKNLFEEIIFTPIGLKSTYYDPDNPVKFGVARGYAEYTKGALIDTTDFDQAARTPDGGIVSNVYDLAKFIKALFQDQLLSNDEFSIMINNLYSDERLGCEDGLGILKINLTKEIYAYGHSGGHFGYTAELWYFPSKKEVIVYLINGSSEFGRYINSIKKIKYEMFKLVVN